jgi:hypothetical protein
MVLNNFCSNRFCNAEASLDELLKIATVFGDRLAKHINSCLHSSCDCEECACATFLLH